MTATQHITAALSSDVIGTYNYTKPCHDSHGSLQISETVEPSLFTLFIDGEKT